MTTIRPMAASIRRSSAAGAVLLGAALLVGPSWAEAQEVAPRVDRGMLDDRHQRFRFPALDTVRRVGAAELVELGLVLHTDRRTGVSRAQAGASSRGTVIPVFRAGTGPIPVALWSGLLGTDPVGAMAVLDVLHFLAAADDDPVAQWLRSRLSLSAVPVVNPEAFETPGRSRNAQGVALDLDGRRLATPEVRALLRVIDAARPAVAIGMDPWHAAPGRPAGINLAAVDAGSAAGAEDRGAPSAAHVAGRVVREGLVEAAAHRWVRGSDPRLVVDAVAERGTAIVLVDTRSDARASQRADAFAVLVSALVAAASRPMHPYVDPPGGRAYTPPAPEAVRADLLMRGGRVVAPGRDPVPADVALRFDASGELPVTRVVEIGDLIGVEATDTLDVGGKVVYVYRQAGRTDEPLQPGSVVALDVRSRVLPVSSRPWRVGDGRVEPWSRYIARQGRWYLSLIPAAYGSQWNDGGNDLVQRFVDEGWNADFDTGAPSVTTTLTPRLGLGYRTRGGFRAEVLVQAPATTRIRAINIDAVEATQLEHSSVAIGVIGGRRAGPIDVGIGPAARVGRFAWSWYDGSNRTTSGFVALGGMVDVSVPLLQVGPALRIDARSAYERYLPVEVPERRKFPATETTFGGWSVGLSLVAAN